MNAPPVGVLAVTANFLSKLPGAVLLPDPPNSFESAVNASFNASSNAFVSNLQVKSLMRCNQSSSFFQAVLPVKALIQRFLNKIILSVTLIPLENRLKAIIPPTLRWRYQSRQELEEGVGLQKTHILGASDEIKKALNWDVATQSLLQLLHHN